MSPRPPAIPEPPLSEWADALEAACARCANLPLRRVRVLAETASTQDAAHAASHAQPGWLVTAGRQTAGRGRLGRAWADTAHHGLAMTLTLPPALACPLRAGLAVHAAAAAHLPPHSADALGLRWPNDVVDRDGRKLAGILIETRGPVALFGIGVNVAQQTFPADLAPRAVSLRQLGAPCSRLDLALDILCHLDALAAIDAPEAAARAAALDTLRGTRRRFLHDGRTHEGAVQAINPDASITLHTDSGETITLPAHTTSLVHEPDRLFPGL